MTWLEFMKRYDNTITEEQGEVILMEETAFPCSDIKITAYQVRQAIRAKINKISLCECCGVSVKFHKPNCYFKEVGV